MDKKKLIQALEDMTVLLQLDGANSFASSAHSRAARALGDFDGDIDALAAEGKLTDISGVGKGIAKKIQEFSESGKITELEELRERIPPGVVEMTRIPGFGAKKARVIVAELGIIELEMLKKACEDGRVAGLKGFGEKTAQKILKGIDQVRNFTGKFRISQAQKAARPVLALLADHKDVEQVEIAGSLRRHKEVVKDIDFVVATDNPESVMEYFTTLPTVVSVEQQGETKSSVTLEGNISADIRCVSPKEFPYTLLHFTGSKEHNTRLRSRAKELNLKLNEYGLFPDGKETPLPAKSEEEIYRHLKLDFIAPEMREDRGEIEAAAEGNLPKLVEIGDFRGIMHMHTHYSDGKPNVEDYAKWAVENKIEWMGIADHSKSLTVARGLPEERVLQQHAEIDKINAKYKKKGVRLLKGIECDILMDGTLDYDEDFRACFEFIVASVHTGFNLTSDEQTKRVCRALEHPHTTILGHMTGRLLLIREGYQIDHQEVIKAAAKNNVAIEINGNPRRLDIDWRRVGYALEQGCMISIGPDAHVMEGLDDTHYGIGIGRKGWLTADRCLNSFSADEFLKFAKKG